MNINSQTSQSLDSGRFHKVSKRLGLISVGIIALGVLNSSCGNNGFSGEDLLSTFTSFFNPKANLRILDIRGDQVINRFSFNFREIGIFQSLSQGGGGTGGNVSLQVQYDFVEPQLTLQNKPGLPRVTFTKGTVRYRLSGTTLPLKEFPINQTLDATSNSETGEKIVVNILTVDSDLRNTVFPGDSPPRVNEGSADLTLFGIDFNNNSIKLEIPLTLRFSSTGVVQLGTPSVTTPSAAPGSTGTGAPASTTGGGR